MRFAEISKVQPLENCMMNKVFWLSEDDYTEHSDGKKKKTETEEEVGRKYQRVDKAQLGQPKTGPEVIKIISCSTQLSMIFSLLIVGILTFMSRK